MRAFCYTPVSVPPRAGELQEMHSEDGNSQWIFVPRVWLARRFATTSTGPAGHKAAPKRTLVRAGHVLDVKTGKLADAQTIVVVGDTIQSIAPSASVAPQPGDAVIDLGGMTVMPGLIDVHTHLTMNPDFDPYRELTTHQREGSHQWRGQCPHHADGGVHKRAQRGRQRVMSMWICATRSMRDKFRGRTCW